MKDILGIAAIGETVKLVTERSLDAASAILGPICQPVAGEIGLMLRDEVRCWRARNLEQVAKKASKFVAITEDGVKLHAHPKIIREIVEQCSWAEDERVQEMWAGLIGSSCTNEGNDDSNLIFIDILSKLTRGQARLLNHACLCSVKELDRGGLYCKLLELGDDELFSLMGTTDKFQISLELDNLAHMRLLEYSFSFDSFRRPPIRRRVIRPLELGLILYVRCQGSRLNPVNFFKPEPVRPKHHEFEQKKD